MIYKNQVFDITRSRFYNVGVEKNACRFRSAPAFFVGKSMFPRATGQTDDCGHLGTAEGHLF